MLVRRFVVVVAVSIPVNNAGKLLVSSQTNDATLIDMPAVCKRLLILHDARIIKVSTDNRHFHRTVFDCFFRTVIRICNGLSCPSRFFFVASCFLFEKTGPDVFTTSTNQITLKPAMPSKYATKETRKKSE